MAHLVLTVRSAIALAVASLAFQAAASRAAQSPEPSAEPRFDVASVKPALSPYELGRQAALGGNGGQRVSTFVGIRTLPGGRFMASTVSVKALIARAFDVKDYQIDGGPKWIASDFFEIAAIAGREATPAEFNTMLKALLADRFGLRTHTETRQLPVRVLTVARGDGRLGAGLKPTSAECKKQLEERKSGASPPQPPPRTMPTTPPCGGMVRTSRQGAGTTMMMGGGELSSLVRRISSDLGGPVVDRTGLSGRFDITLDYTPARQGVALNASSTDAPPPPISAAVQEQLGLKLQTEIAPLQVVIVDAADHPTPD